MCVGVGGWEERGGCQTDSAHSVCVRACPVYACVRQCAYVYMCVRSLSLNDTLHRPC